MALQIVFGLLLVAQGVNNSVSAWHTFGGGSPRSPLFGIWNVTYMSIDGVERAPLVTDYDRWRRLTFDVPTRMAFHRMDDTFVQFNSKIDVMRSRSCSPGPATTSGARRSRSTGPHPIA